MSDPEQTVQQIIDSGRRVRFGKGVIAKTAYVAAIVVATWAFVVWRLSDDILLNCFLLGAGLIATAFGWWFVRSSQNFAQKNPAQAMLDGAELLEWQRMDLAAKGVGNLPPGPPIAGQIASSSGEIG